ADVPDHHRGARPGQRLGHPFAEPTAAAGHQRLPPGQVVHAHQGPLSAAAPPQGNWDGTRLIAFPWNLTLVKALFDDGQEKSGQSSRRSASPYFRVLSCPKIGWYFGATPRNDRILTVSLVKEQNRDRVARRQVDKF